MTFAILRSGVRAPSPSMGVPASGSPAEWAGRSTRLSYPRCSGSPPLPEALTAPPIAWAADTNAGALPSVAPSIDSSEPRALAREAFDQHQPAVDAKDRDERARVELPTQQVARGLRREPPALDRELVEHQRHEVHAPARPHRRHRRRCRADSRDPFGDDDRGTVGRRLEPERHGPELAHRLPDAVLVDLHLVGPAGPGSRCPCDRGRRDRAPRGGRWCRTRVARPAGPRRPSGASTSGMTRPNRRGAMRHLPGRAVGGPPSSVVAERRAEVTRGRRAMRSIARGKRFGRFDLFAA